jgi:hypothetical protein
VRREGGEGVEKSSSHIVLSTGSTDNHAHSDSQSYHIIFPTELLVAANGNRHSCVIAMEQHQHLQIGVPSNRHFVSQREHPVATVAKKMIGLADDISFLVLRDRFLLLMKTFNCC